MNKQRFEQVVNDQGWLLPDWPAPDNVFACTTTRQGGVSEAPFDGLNLGDHVNDIPQAVVRNRQFVGDVLEMPTEPLWLKQVHGTTIINTQTVVNTPSCHPVADASVMHKAGQVSVIMTADCLPVLFCNRQGTQVAGAHAGWRGLCDGIVEKTLDQLTGAMDDRLVWLGPCIGPKSFEIGSEVREAFMAHDAQAQIAFQPGQAPGKWWADLYALARQRLQAAGVPPQNIYGGEYCTFTDQVRFFSYRREALTGRMGSFIWFA